MSPLANSCERRVLSDIALDEAVFDINRLASVSIPIVIA